MQFNDLLSSAKQLNPSKQVELIKSLEPVGKAEKPEFDVELNYTHLKAGGKMLDYEKIKQEYQELNNKLYNLENIKYFVKLQRVRVKDLSIDAVHLGKVRGVTSIKYQRGEWVYPSTKRMQIIFHLLLAPTTSRTDEGENLQAWYVRQNMTHLHTSTGSSFLTDVALVREGVCLEHDYDQLTPDIAHILRTGLSARHLTSNGYYNHYLIQLEVLAFHHVYIDTREDNLLMSTQAIKIRKYS